MGGVVGEWHWSGGKEAGGEAISSQAGGKGRGDRAYYGDEAAIDGRGGVAVDEEVRVIGRGRV